VLVAMGTTLAYRRVVFVVAMAIATNDVIADDVCCPATTVASSSASAADNDNNLTLLLLTPLDGILGFEQNAAASTLALKQAQTDGLLAGVNVSYVGRLFSFCAN